VLVQVMPVVVAVSMRVLERAVEVTVAVPLGTVQEDGSCEEQCSEDDETGTPAIAEPEGERCAHERRQRKE
jgi:hypothetical protein